MIRIASQPHPTTPIWHAAFATMLPAIARHARISFRHLSPEAKAEAIEEAVCNACCAVARLAELGKLDLAYPTVLARFAVAQVREGRKVGCKLSVRDVLSPYCRRLKGVIVERLDRYDADEDCWQEILIPDRHCTPAELAASRIDFPAWLATLKPRDRKIALKLATGETTGATAARFHMSAARVSQIRTELKQAWERFQGEQPSPAVA